MAGYREILYLGTRKRGAQVAIGIPGGEASNYPGVLVLPSGATTPTEYKLFMTTAGVLRATSGTAFADSDGTAVGAAASVTLDQAYDNGQTINGAVSLGTAIRLGGVSKYLSLYHDNTNMYATVSSGDLYLTATNLQLVATNIMCSGLQAQTGSMVYLNGATGTGWVGADAKGILSISNSGGTLAHANASCLQIVNASTPANTALGFGWRVIDTSAAAGAKPAYAAYITSTNNDGLSISTTLAAATQVAIIGPASQTTPALKITCTTGAGWIGAAATGVITIAASGGTMANAASSCLYIACAQIPAASAAGTCINLVETGTAIATAAALGIASTNNLAIKVSAGICDFSVASARLQCSNYDSADPPTNANAISAFGAVATTGKGFIGILDDAGGHSNEFLIWNDGSKYWQITATACT